MTSSKEPASSAKMAGQEETYDNIHSLDLESRRAAPWWMEVSMSGCQQVVGNTDSTESHQ